MNAEKFIKNEAKRKLSGNWVLGVFSTLVLLFIPIMSALMLMMAYSLLGDYDDLIKTLSGSSVTAALFVVFHLVAVIAMILLSPIYCGFIRVFSGFANGKNVDPADLIYFFENKSKYKSAVRFMTSIIMKSVGIFILCEAVGAAVISLAGDNDALLGVGILLAVAGALTAFCFIHRFVFSAELFSYEDYRPDEAAKFGAKLAKGNTFKLIKLSASFVPWLLITFFVVPFVYVYPYMTCSYFVSIKYIIEQYNKQAGDVPVSPFNARGGIANPNYTAQNAPNTARSGADIKNLSQIPPITRDRERASHFPQNNAAFTESLSKSPLQNTENKENTDSVENSAENKDPISLEKGGTVDSDL